MKFFELLTDILYYAFSNGIYDIKQLDNIPPKILKVIFRKILFFKDFIIILLIN